MGRQRQIKGRRSRYVDGALGLTIIWLGMVYFFYVGGGLNGKSNPLPVIGFTIVVPIVWFLVIRVLLSQNAAGKTVEQLRSLSPDAFEEWVAARFRELGYAVKVTGRGGDHGVDLVVEKGGETAIVQCKKFRNWSVGEPVLRDLYGAMHDFGARRAYLVTTGSLTKSATDWVAGKPIEVWDADRLARVAAQHTPTTHRSGKGAVKPQAVSSQSTASDALPTPASPAVAVEAKPACPKCGSELVQKLNRSTGQPFLACPKFPACRHTQPLER